MARRPPGWTISVESISWGDIVNKPAWISRLEYFANNPVKTVLGIVFAAILSGIFDLVNLFVGAIILAWEGSAIGYQPWETPGLADVPVMTAIAIGQLFSPVAGEISRGVEAWNSTLFSLANSTGPFGPVIVGLVGLGVFALMLRAAIAIASDIPGVGAVLEFLGLT